MGVQLADGKWLQVHNCCGLRDAVVNVRIQTEMMVQNTVVRGFASAVLVCLPVCLFDQEKNLQENVELFAFAS